MKVGYNGQEQAKIERKQARFNFLLAKAKQTGYAGIKKSKLVGIACIELGRAERYVKEEVRSLIDAERLFEEDGIVWVNSTAPNKLLPKRQVVKIDAEKEAEEIFSQNAQ